MLIDKWKPFYAPETETGTPEVDSNTPPPEVDVEEHDGPGSGRSAIRKSLESGFEKNRKAAEEAEKKGSAGRQRTGRRIAGGAELDQTPEGEETQLETEETAPQTQAPEAFSKEAKAEWAKVPAAVQQAILKREQDTTKGVEELKGKYKDIDAAIAPHLNAIRQSGRSPAEAVNQLFGWFQALSQNPVVAFPALAKSFGWDLTQFVQPQAQNQQPQQAPTEQQQEDLPPAVKNYIADMQKELGQLKQAFGGFQQQTTQQNEQRTNEILANWSKDKPHFEEVRQMMAHLIQSGAIPLKDNKVDLDAAYDAAVWAIPDVRSKVQAEQQAASQEALKKKQADLAAKKQAEADKARKTAVGVTGGAPGEINPNTTKKGARKSVKDSIREAMEQLTE
ncbi:MAG TPA: hypothetical protein VFR24_27445 [Candidatus Angelobacter sp.]|nr:hypothetical protein [Candidatus Angelobacter sp.]